MKMRHVPHLTFQSRGRAVRLEAFFPEIAVQCPALLLLHGASGLYGGNRYIPQLAGALAEQGLATLIVHYFDATGTSWAGEAEIWGNFDQWLKTIGDAVSAAMARPEVDATRLGLVGYSLGGYLAVAFASRDPRIRAVVEFAGGIDPDFAKGVTRLPPTMIVHGKADRRVPFDRALSLEKVLQQLGTPHATHFYPGEGHLFSAAAGLDALTAGVEFLREHLGVTG